MLALPPVALLLLLLLGAAHEPNAAVAAAAVLSEQQMQQIRARSPDMMASIHEAVCRRHPDMCGSVEASLPPPSPPLGTVTVDLRSDGNTASVWNAEDILAEPGEEPSALEFVSLAEPTLIVVDDFYHDALAVRRRLLAHPEWFNVSGNYPGRRTAPMVTDAVRRKIQRHVRRRIRYWPLEQYNGAFQLATADDPPSWVHCDETEWSGVLFLTPGAPADSGTTLFRHRAHGLRQRPSEREARAAGYESAAALMVQLDAASQRYDEWEALDRVGNVFNRLVLFKGRHFHQSTAYFGHALDDGRLFQTFFFDTADEEADGGSGCAVHSE